MNLNEIKPKDDEEKFYQELDEKKAHGSCCTCQTLAILFTVIFFLGLGGVFYLYFQITHGGFTESFNAFLPTTDFASKIKNIQPDTSGEFQIVLTSNDLSNLLNDGFSTQNFILKDIHTSINSSNILIYGTLVKPLSSKVVITAIPVVADGKINLEIKKISAGNLNLPSFIASNLSSSISNLLNQKTALLYKNHQVTKIQLGENQTTIIGRKK